jgi:hypothetical protein
MTTVRHSRPWMLGLLGASGLLGLLAAPLTASAAPWGTTAPRYGTIRYGTPTVAPAPPTRYYRSDYGAPGYPPQGYAYANPADPALAEAQLARRCNIGRLVGGIVGGGVGYAASRQEGRTWAVPLGALLGTQMGCNLGVGNAPLPW